jgi:hypothetical protein
MSVMLSRIPHSAADALHTASFTSLPDHYGELMKPERIVVSSPQATILNNEVDRQMVFRR